MYRYSAFAIVLLCFGCGGTSGPQATPVSGVVMNGDKPLDGAVVMFIPQNGPRATGTTDSTGRFQLTTIAPNDGAYPGDYSVAVTKTVSTNDKDMYARHKSLIPEKFGHPDKSGLKATVKSGEPNEVTLNLK
ncbi:carboxypeptidase-like regulatory domain-containing protein [Planctomicrobium sp. SH668]|uniref:carboxypeptidase-like regulatory domain-containing protein n=1 Tax=Planctomicrobium sp. SH668 TaxID=3448126 RepID=UPI003F5C9150